MNPTPLPTSHTFTAAINYLTANQASDGSFTALRRSVPLHAAVLEALSGLAATLPIRKKLAAWLRKTEQGTDGAASREDLYTTFALLNAFQAHDPGSISGETLGQVVKQLVSAEVQVGGPYYTHARTIDLAVNAQISRFIAAVAQPLPNIQALLEEAGQRNAWHSRHYTPLATQCLAAQAGSPELRLGLARQVVNTVAYAPSQALQTALAALLLIRQKLPVPEWFMRQLAATQRTDGSWAPEAYCAANADAEPSGTSIVTTAWVVAALGVAVPAPLRAVQAAAQPAQASPPSMAPAPEEIYRQANALFAQLDPMLQQEAAAIMETIGKADQDHEIVCLPAWFAEGLRAKPRKLPEDFFATLGLANLCNWVSFTLYDDFYDGVGRASTLPLANACLHHSLRLFQQALPEHQGFQQLVHDTFDALDSANAWEIGNCRLIATNGKITVPALPPYTDLRQLSDRSFTHILPVLAVLAAQGVDLQGKPAKAIREAGRHYLACRQLNDDMHDWEEDLQAGCLTYTLAVTLSQAGIPAGEYSYDGLYQRVRQRFWTEAILTVCSDLEGQIAAGQQAIARSGLLTTDNVFARLFASLEQTVAHTRAEQGKAIGFLREYKKKRDPL